MDGGAHLVNGLQVRTQSAMNAEYPTVHDRPQCQVVEHFATPSPNVRTRILPLALVVKAIDLGDLAGFVISADERDAFGVADFESEKEEEGLYRVETSVDKVT